MKKIRNILAIDTSSHCLSMAITRGEDLLAEKNCKRYRSHSSEIATLLNQLLKRRRLNIKDIDLFAVSIGPGSFTGLRVGTAFIKGLVMDLKRPIVAVVSLDVIASRLKDRAEFICPIVDAKRGNVYTALYATKDGCLRRCFGYSVIDVEELIKRLKKIKSNDAKMLFTADGLKAYRSRLQDAFGKKCIFADEKFWYPRACFVAKEALKMYNRGKLIPIQKLRPMYLYPRDIQCRR